MKLTKGFSWRVRKDVVNVRNRRNGVGGFIIGGVAKSGTKIDTVTVRVTVATLIISIDYRIIECLLYNIGYLCKITSPSVPRIRLQHFLQPRLPSLQISLAPSL